MPLSRAFGLQTGDVAALVGAGGKTSLLFRVAAEQAARQARVLVTTTTKIWPPQPEESDLTVITPDEGELRLRLREWPGEAYVLTAAAGLTGEGKLRGYPLEVIDRLAARGTAACMLVEADGAHGRAFKAPAGHEPVIPRAATLVVPVVGLDALNKPLDDVFVYRSALAADLAEASPGEPVTVEIISRVLSHPGGYRKDIPAGARWIPLINLKGRVELYPAACALAHRLLNEGAERVVVGQPREAQPVVEVFER